MPRERVGQVYVEWHGDHWDSRFELADGKLTKRHCHPCPARLRGETEEQAKARAKQEAKDEARAAKAIAWRDGWTLAADPKPESAGETLGAYVDRWLATRRDPKEAGEHWRFHLFAVLDARKPIASFVRRDAELVVQALDDKARAGQISAKTARNAWGTCSKLFDDAVNAKRLELRALDGKPNPCAGVRPPDRGDEKQSAWLFPREASALFACERVPLWWRTYFALALYTGLRAGELAVLRIADVALEAGYIGVHQARDRTKEGATKSTKGRRARRVVIEPALHPMLVTMAKGREGAEPLLRTPKKRAAADILRHHLQLAGVKREELHASDDHRRPLSFHDLRHTYATWLALRGDPALVIQSRLGHASAEMTQHYIEAAEAVGHGNVGAPFPELPAALVNPNRESQPSAENLNDYRAGDGIRTRDVNLGKVALYH